jgi:hypothetical protein
MLKMRQPYQELGQAAYEARYRERRIKTLQHQAAPMGYQLAPQPVLG